MGSLKQPNPMHTKLLVILFALLSLTFAQEYTVTQVLDDWEDFGNPVLVQLFTDAPPAVQNEDSVITNFAIGGERDVLVVATEGAYGAVVSAIVSGGELNLSVPPRVSGYLLVQYDGLDGTSELNANGLNRDLTVNNGDRFRIRLECDIGATITIKIYSNGELSEASFTVGRLEGLQDVYVPFSEFSGNADFANVGAIELFIPFEANLDIGIEEFDIAVPTEDFDFIFEFVQPIEGHYIDYELHCERKVVTTSDFSSSSSSSAAILLPSLLGLLLLLL